MTAMCFAKSTQSGYCSTCAAEGASIHIARVMDTAVFAVSIFVILFAARLAG